jgi:hypothetical protein
MEIKERRENSRYSPDMTVNIYSMCQTKNERAKVRDISIDGVSFESNNEFLAGEDVTFNFLPLALKIKGTIRWVNRKTEKYTYGAKFKNLSFINRIALNSIIFQQI